MAADFNHFVRLASRGRHPAIAGLIEFIEVAAKDSHAAMQIVGLEE